MEPKKVQSFSLGQRIVVASVSVYLTLAGLWLALTGVLQLPSFTKILRAHWRSPYRRALVEIQHQEGNSYTASVPELLLSDKDSVSRLVVYEDDRPLEPAHAAHTDIRELGGGRFSHWGATVYFSTSDNSDPSANGREYSVREEPRA